MSSNEANDREARIPRIRKPATFWWLVAGAAGLAVSGLLLQRGASHMRQAHAKPPYDPPLVIAPSELNLGRVYESNAYQHQIRISNTTEEALTISRFITSCDCAGISPPGGIRLRPHETRPFTLTLALVPKGNPNGSMDPEPFHVNIGAICVFDKDAFPPMTAATLGLLATPLGKGPLLAPAGFHTDGWASSRDQRTDWRLTSDVVPTVRLVPQTIYLGIQSVRQGVVETNADIKASADITSVLCFSDDPWEVKAVRHNQDLAGSTFRLAIRSRGKLILRHVDDFVQIVPVDHRNQKLSSKRLRIMGDFVHDVVPTPPEIHFGRQAIAAVAEEAIVLRSLTGHKFRVAKTFCNNPDLTVAPRAKNDAERLFFVRIRMAKEGCQEATVVFTIVDDQGLSYPLSIPIKYYGIKGIAE